ncbi:MAG TPA: aminotransferase class V-fold PLP-dependent enzyme [Gemmatimonadales bacterium]|nr:aminotransferase class V-fold PLP-dependent enzyme [Gemmatimonadales bacterium]
MAYRAGRHFLQIPGPTNVPDRVLRAMDRPTIDHRGPAFAELTREVLTGLKQVFDTASHVVIYPASGSGAWEAALVNTLSPGDKVLAFDQGFFAVGWARVAARMGLEVELVPWDWRRGLDGAKVEERLARDTDRLVKAVMVVHNETSSGVTTNVTAIRQVLDRLDHPALLMVDTVSSLGSMDYRHDAWRVDVTVAGSQKGLMLPPGLSFNAISDRAWRARGTARLPRSYWSWDDMVEYNATGYFPSTPATNLLFGLREALAMLREEGLANAFARHRRLAAAARAAVTAWGLEVFAQNPAEQSDTVTAVLLPSGRDAEAVRRAALERFDLSLGAGLGKLKGQVFRIGHLGDFNELMLMGTLAGVEMALSIAGPPAAASGVQAAMAHLATSRPG